MNYQEYRDRFEAGQIYGYREVLKKLYASQSSTAEHILADLLASGSMVRLADNKYRINI